MLPNTEARERPSHRTNRVGCADADLHRCGVEALVSSEEEANSGRSTLVGITLF